MSDEFRLGSYAESSKGEENRRAFRIETKPASCHNLGCSMPAKNCVCESPNCSVARKPLMSEEAFKNAPNPFERAVPK